MDSFCIYCICVLKTYLTPFYPKEIIMLIISMIHHNPRVYCGWGCTSFIIDGNVYACGQQISYEKVLYPTKQLIPLGKIDSINHRTNHNSYLAESKRDAYVCGKKISMDLETISNISLGDTQVGLEDCEYTDTWQKTILSFKSNMTLITGGDHYTIVVTENGECYGWGSNKSGELGLTNRMIYNSVQKLPVLDVKSVSCGYYYTIILTKNECFGCGMNRFGQLGLGCYGSSYSLQKINLSNPILIACGYSHTFILTTNGIYSCGYNRYGQLGLGHTNKQNLLQKVDLLNSSIISIKCGQYYSILLTKQGELLVCGHNYIGQLGLGNETDYNVFQKLCWNEFVVSINCGEEHTIAITRSGKCYGWGNNKGGQLGLGDTKNKSEPAEIVVRI